MKTRAELAAYLGRTENLRACPRCGQNHNIQHLMLSSSWEKDCICGARLYLDRDEIETGEDVYDSYSFSEISRSPDKTESA